MFINIEGVDCSGKSTITSLLSQYKVCKIYKSPISPILEVKNTLFTEWSDISRAFVFMGTNLEISERAANNLKDNELVIIDRYIWSTFAYHIALNALSEKHALSLFNILREYLILPDTVIFLDVDRKTQLLRAQYRQDDILQKKLMASDDFQVQLRSAYSKISCWSDCNWVSIDSTEGDSKFIAEKILSLIEI